MADVTLRNDFRPGDIGEIVRLQGACDYEGTKAFLAKWAVMDDQAKQVTATMGHIPVDIWPIYPKSI